MQVQLLLVAQAPQQAQQEIKALHICTTFGSTLLIEFLHSMGHLSQSLFSYLLPDYLDPQFSLKGRKGYMAEPRKGFKKKEEKK